MNYELPAHINNFIARGLRTIKCCIRCKKEIAKIYVVDLEIDTRSVLLQCPICEEIFKVTFVPSQFEMN